MSIQSHITPLPYKLVIAYDGTLYHGWQEQAGQKTVAGVLQQKFKHLFDQEIKVLAASRTDAGVHALGQVARFYTTRIMPLETMMRSWNAALPGDIHIRALEPITDSFHPQHNVSYKIYYYHFFTRRPLPHMARYGYYFYHQLDFEKLRDSLKLFKGTHDFTSCCFKAWRHENKLCTVQDIRLEYIHKYGMYRIVIQGDRFLHNMVRRMVGTALKIAAYKELSPTLVTQVLSEPRLDYMLPTAPAHGLVLRKIVYKR